MLDQFRHIALWDADNEWVEMRLEAQRPMTVHLADLGLTVSFEAGEQLRTEISAKFRLPGITAELAAAGFNVQRAWTDTEHRFALIYADRNSSHAD